MRYDIGVYPVFIVQNSKVDGANGYLYTKMHGDCM